jgi:transketolase
MPEKWPEIKAELLAAAGRKEGAVATRKSSQNCLDLLVDRVPELLGGSADLTGSNLTAGKGSIALHEAGERVANYISYGVREFGMTAIMNGIALHGGLIPYGGTFAVFSDYARNAIRMSALMKQRVIHVLTHDSIGLGEDGPTHQPIEHVSSLRIIPGLDVWRPCDELETAVAWTAAIERQNGPSALLLSRQNLPQYGGATGRAEGASRGGYVLAEADGPLQAVIIATGSEVDAGHAGAGRLAGSGRRRARRLDALHAALQPSRPAGKTPCCRRTSSASPSRPGRPTSGTVMSASMARCSASTSSAPRPRRRCSTSTTA